MGTLLDLAERAWTGAVAPRQHWQPTGQREEIAPGLIFLHAFANVSVLRTDEGLVLVDTASAAARDKTFAAVRAIDPAPLATAVFTHGHADHVGGMPPFLAEATAAGRTRPRIVGHRNVSARFARYCATNGYNAIINARQFGIPVRWPLEYDAPDTTYDDTLTLTVGGVTLELHHARGETDDHTWLWWPARRVLFSGDHFIWVAPNAGNPQKVQRYAEDWARSLRAMEACGAELLVPGHGMPIVGRARVQQALSETAEWLEHLVRETVARMNAGLTLDAIVNEVKPPAHLAERPYLQAVYDEPEYVVRNIWRLYGGWWDGVASHLKPVPESVLGREVVGLAGGLDALLDRVRTLVAAGDVSLASHLVDWAVAAEPESPAAHELRARVYEARAASAGALMTRGIFSATAADSARRAGGTPALSSDSTGA